MSTITVKIDTRIKWTKSMDYRNDKLNRILESKETGFYLIYNDTLVARLDYLGDSRIDGYPYFKVNIVESTHTISDCKLMHNDEIIPFSEMELMDSTLGKVYTGC